MGSFDFGSFAGGLAQGINRGTELKLRKEEADLRSKLIDHQLKAQEFDLAEEQRKAELQRQQQIQLGEDIDRFVQTLPQQPGQPPAPLQPGQEGPVPAPDFVPPSQPQFTPETAFQVAAMRQGKFLKPTGASTQNVEAQLEALKKFGLINGGQQPGQTQRDVGFTVGPTGVTVRANPRRAGVGRSAVLTALDQKIAMGTATPEEMAARDAIMRTVNETAAAAGGGRVQGTTAAQLGQPVPGQATQGPTTSNTGANAPQPGESDFNRAKRLQSQATTLGSESVKSRARVGGLQSARFTISTIKGLLDTIPAPPPGVVSRGANAVKLWFQTKGQTQPSVARIEDTKKSFATSLSRSVLAERGVLTDRDREVAVNTLPGANDTEAVRRGKLATLSQFIDVMEEFEDLLQSGMPAEQARVEFQRRFQEIEQRQQQVIAEGLEQTAFETLPDPAQFQGKVMVDDATGARFQSDGKRWIPQPRR